MNSTGRSLILKGLVVVKGRGVQQHGFSFYFRVHQHMHVFRVQKYACF